VALISLRIAPTAIICGASGVMAPLYLSYDLKPFEWTGPTRPDMVERSETELQTQAE
jgi:hypothetical protein